MTSQEPLSMTAAAAALREGTLTSVDLVRRSIALADALDDTVGIYLARYDDTALAAADDADAALRSGRDLGPLHGIPIGIKDVITTREGETTGQSRVHDRTLLVGDAAVVRRIRDAGGIITGKTTTMELAIGAPDESHPFPMPRNPWNLDHWAGGSSSGSASGVATGVVLGALGTDTAGSIRTPSAFCGISGIMPTFGRVPMSGVIPLAYSLDRVGPMARSARDCAIMLDVLAGHDTSDPSSVPTPDGNPTSTLTGDLDGVRIGVDRLRRHAGDFYDPALTATFDSAIAILWSRGAQIVDIELPHFAEISAATMIVLIGEAAALHRSDLRRHWREYSSAFRAVLGTSALYSAADYVLAQRARTVGVDGLKELFGSVDLIVTPTQPGPAVAFADLPSALRGEGMPSFTAYWNALGNPVLSVPIGITSSGLPLGMQIAGRPFDEALVLRAGDAFQQHTSWHLQLPSTSPPSAA